MIKKITIDQKFFNLIEKKDDEKIIEFINLIIQEHRKEASLEFSEELDKKDKNVLQNIKKVFLKAIKEYEDQNNIVVNIIDLKKDILELEIQKENYGYLERNKNNQQ